MLKDWGPAVSYSCTNCNNERVWHLCKHSVWFTLFFIPVFPYRYKRLLICPVCSNHIELTQAEVDRLRPAAELNLALVQGKISEVEHRQEIKKLELNASLKSARKHD